jgi:regulator of replication initiation timing
MKGHVENEVKSDKQAAFQIEFDKLAEIFKDVEEPKRKLVEGLIQEAAFLYSENCELRNILKSTGTVKCHPEHPELQKTVPAAGQYLKNLNSYAVVIKTLNGVLSKNIIDDMEDMSDFE